MFTSTTRKQRRVGLR